MPPPKRNKKTGNESTVNPEEDGSNSPTPHKLVAKGHRDAKSIPKYEYICFHRPLFDFEAENQTKEDDELEDDELFEVFKKEFESYTAKGLFLEPAAQHKDWKWIIMFEGWKMSTDLKRQTKYCDPDNFDMYIYNDFKGWGMHEIIENMILEFDKQIRLKTSESFYQMWAIVSALGLWLNDDDMEALIMNEDGEKTRELHGLIGCALLTALGAIEAAGELKPDSKFLDLALVISLFLVCGEDLPQYGIEEDAVFWVRHAVKYFKKGGLDTEKGMFGTATLLEELGDSDDEEEENNGNADKNADKNTDEDMEDAWEDDDDEDKFVAERSEKDPWAWNARFSAYKRKHRPVAGSHKYDITKMSRKERASHAFNKKDPLADVPMHILREGLLDFE